MTTPPRQGKDGVMEDLIKRLSEADGPDRALDTEIYARAVRRDLADSYTEHYGFFEGGGDGKGWHYAPRYTESLDAAMTLVPERAQWTLEADAAWVRVLTPDDVDEFQGNFCRRDGNCTALALCIAALKARIQP